MAQDRTYSNEAMRGLSNYIESTLKRGLVCCPNCIHFARNGERCALNNLRPPAPVIAFGCERFEFDDIPF